MGIYGSRLDQIAMHMNRPLPVVRAFYDQNRHRYEEVVRAIDHRNSSSMPSTPTRGQHVSQGSSVRTLPEHLVNQDKRPGPQIGVFSPRAARATGFIDGKKITHTIIAPMSLPSTPLVSGSPTTAPSSHSTSPVPVVPEINQGFKYDNQVIHGLTGYDGHVAPGQNLQYPHMHHHPQLPVYQTPQIHPVQPVQAVHPLHPVHHVQILQAPKMQTVYQASQVQNTQQVQQGHQFQHSAKPEHELQPWTPNQNAQPFEIQPVQKPYSSSELQETYQPPLQHGDAAFENTRTPVRHPNTHSSPWRPPPGILPLIPQKPIYNVNMTSPMPLRWSNDRFQESHERTR